MKRFALSDGPCFATELLKPLFQEDCATELAFSKSSKLKLFRGAPPTVSDVLNALQVHA